MRKVNLSLLSLAWPRDVSAKQPVCLMFCIFRKFKTSRKYFTVTLNKEEKDFPLAYSIVIHQKVNVMGATEVVSLDPANVCGQLGCLERKDVRMFKSKKKKVSSRLSKREKVNN